MLLQDFAPLGELERLDGRVSGAKLLVQLFGEKALDPVQAAPEQRRIRRRRAGHLLGDRAGERDERRQARILEARVALAREADAVEQSPHRMLERIERRVLGQADPQRRDLHARDQRAQCALQDRVFEKRLEQSGDQLDDLPLDRLARAREQRRTLLVEALTGRRAARLGAFEGGLAQQLVEAQQRLLEGGAAPAAAIAAHRSESAGAAARFRRAPHPSAAACWPEAR